MASVSPLMRTKAFLKPRGEITVLTFAHLTLYNLLMALRICLLLARMSTKKVRIFSDYQIRQLWRKNLNLLHRSLAHSRLLNDSVSVHLILLRNSMSLVLGLTSQLKSLGAEEMNVGMNMACTLLLNTLSLLSSGSG